MLVRKTYLSFIYVTLPFFLIGNKYENSITFIDFTVSGGFIATKQFVINQ